VITSIDEQSPDIAQGVDESNEHEQGAGDQGLMFGYACDETPELMPMPIIYAHRLTRRLAEVRKQKILDFLRPDGKSQVTIQYINGKPVRVDSVVIAAQHSDKVAYETLKEGIIEEVVH
jgi:S-adenosylmethionine synthetase